jgi:hypothetical protein
MDKKYKHQIHKANPVDIASIIFQDSPKKITFAANGQDGYEMIQKDKSKLFQHLGGYFKK